MSRCVAFASFGLALAVATAHAEDRIARGSVVKVEHGEIYVSLGAAHGVASEAPLRLKRTIRLRHPVTRAAIEDWIPIGSATVTQAGSSLSRAVLGELVEQVKVGDVVEVLVEVADAPPPPAPTPPPPPPDAPPQPAPDPVALEVLGVFAQQTGAALDARIASWERYLSQRPQSPYAEAIARDLDQLRGLRDQLAPSGLGPTQETVSTVRHEVQTSAATGREVPLVFVLDAPEGVASAYLHYRTRGARTFRRVLLVREHDIYLRGSLPADVVVPPGVEYFVEVSTPTGRSGAALASAIAPIGIEVEKPTVLDRFGPAVGRSSVKLAADYLDFATFDTREGNHRDTMVTANVDFTYRLVGKVKSVGVGYGVLAGAGGYKDTPFDELPVQRTGFHFGYADVEVGAASARTPLSVGGKLIAGVGKQGFGLGFEARVRVGDAEHTNLALAVRTLEQIGTLTDIRFGARPARDLLVGVSVGATNQPNRGDVGVKLGTELEWIGFHHVSVILRGSWQGRSVDHGGIGGGGGLGFYW